MLMGVLVIAFPVSVFSDLWSHELKQMKGFEDLNHDDDDVDGNEERVEEFRVFSSSSRNLEAAISEVTPLRPHQQQLSGRSHEHVRDMVVMHKDDLKELVECVYNIKENQRRLHTILRKYRILEETDTRGRP